MSTLRTIMLAAPILALTGAAALADSRDNSYGRWNDPYGYHSYRADYRDALEDNMRRLNRACDRGDRRACVQYGIAIGEHRERMADWRRRHPEYFWYER